MLRLNEIKEKMKDRKIHIVVESVGLKPWHVRNVLSGKSPNYFHVEKLSDYLEKSEVKE